VALKGCREEQLTRDDSLLTSLNLIVLDDEVYLSADYHLLTYNDNDDNDNDDCNDDIK
jgi:hypothetical protein